MTADRHTVSRRAVLGAGAAVTLAAAVGAEVSKASVPDPTSIPPPRIGPRIDIVCDECGGNSVSRDAWADWDVEVQDWVLGAVFDYGHCHDCDGESSLREIELIGGTAD